MSFLDNGFKFFFFTLDRQEKRHVWKLINDIFASICHIRFNYYILSSLDDISDFIMRLHICDPINESLIFLIDLNNSFLPLR